MEMTLLNTLGKLADRGHRLFGSCLSCASRYDPRLGPRNQPSQYDIDLDALIAERGRACRIVGMAPPTCPSCGSRRTEIRLLPQRRAAATWCTRPTREKQVGPT